ncbi:hypothetical protein GCM10009721_39040 [Terrabacter tumescens]|uniref:DUF4328 domain-containing protein n=1 Tax=Terrabacter tumescens TaxID=60443 RepID=A0ABQ2IE59_9MICO|nr:DUF4328 domain-containing protein [Terrabacter tumescens]GGN07486.1 hypothetical protein GCM10009721_39040 [Terrabacter tumescens]
MTQPAAPYEPPASPAVPTASTVPTVPTVPTGAQPAATATAPPPPPAPAAAQTGVTANVKNVAVRPWRQSTAVVAVMTQAAFVVGALANLYLTSLDVKVKGQLEDRDFAAMEREAQSADGLYLLILGVGALSAILLLVWFHRVWTSDRSDHSLYTRGTGMAIGGWFIPFANFVLGPLALRDLLWGVEHASPEAKPGRPAATPRLVIAFWVVIAVNLVLVMLGRGAESGLQRPDSIDALMTSVQASLTYEALGGVAGAAGAVIAILYIRKVMALTRR